MRGPLPTAYGRRAILVSVLDRKLQLADGMPPLEELGRLAGTAGAVVAGELVQRRVRFDPATLAGSGKIDEIGELMREKGANLVIFDNNLSPTQLRNIEDRIKGVVMDRTELILNIFAIHARSAEAKLQVELVQMKYMLPRLVGRRKSLEQFQATAAVGGGLAAGRGPGEKQIEYDRRLLRRRIHDMGEQIRKIHQRRERMVRKRTASNFTVSLVGYTNAGKSTLMRRLTGAQVLVEDVLFATLDTKTSTWAMDTGLKVLISDTVGFIENLPPDLVTAFYATLEEVREANALLHVADASSPHLASYIQAVEDVLKRIKCDGLPRVLLLNKIDRVPEHVERAMLEKRFPEAVLISAVEGSGVDALAARVSELISDRVVDATLRIPVTEGKVIAHIFAAYSVMNRSDEDEFIVIKARIPRRDFYRFKRYAT